MTNDREIPVTPLGLSRVLIGHETHFPAGEVPISIPGGLIRVDPARPDVVPSCLVIDAAAARESIAEIYGPKVAADTLRMDPHHEGKSVASHLGPDDLRELVVQLAGVRWCQVNAPLDLDPHLLRLEELTLLGSLAELLDDETDWSAELSLECGRLLRREQRWIETASPEQLDLVAEAMELMANHAPVADATARRARDYLTRSTRATRLPDTSGAPGVAAKLRPQPALVAGGSAALFSGTSTVDWLDVPIPLTTREENNVHWMLDLLDDRAELTVVADATSAGVAWYREKAETSGTAFRLSFDCHLTGWPFPALTGLLDLDESTATWTGKAVGDPHQRLLLSDGIEQRESIDIRVRTSRITPVPDPTFGEAHRWTCRGVTSLRFAADDRDRDLLDSAAESLQRAGELWRACGVPENSEECRWLMRVGTTAAASGGGLPATESFRLTVAERAWKDSHGAA